MVRCKFAHDIDDPVVSIYVGDICANARFTLDHPMSLRGKEVELMAGQWFLIRNNEATLIEGKWDRIE